jgi:hypothetical protein
MTSEKNEFERYSLHDDLNRSWARSRLIETLKRFGIMEGMTFQEAMEKVLKKTKGMFGAPSQIYMSPKQLQQLSDIYGNKKDEDE